MSDILLCKLAMQSLYNDHTKLAERVDALTEKLDLAIRLLLKREEEKRTPRDSDSRETEEHEDQPVEEDDPQSSLDHEEALRIKRNETQKIRNSAKRVVCGCGGVSSVYKTKRDNHEKSKKHQEWVGKE